MNIKCVRHGLRCDWREKAAAGNHVLCHDESARWWEISNAMEIEVIASLEPHPSGYECTTDGSYLNIKAENTYRWYRYYMYATLSSALLREFGSKTFYLGVEVVK